MDNLTVYSGNAITTDTVDLAREAVFSSNKDVVMAGYTGEVAIDAKGRVYVVGSQPGALGVYVFNPDGSYRTRFLREGRGPGEFESIASMIIENNRIYILGPRLQKIGIFSLDDYSLVDDYIINRKGALADSLGTYRASELLSVSEEGEMLVRFKAFSLENPNKQRTVPYYWLSEQAEVQPGVVLKQKDTYRYEPAAKTTSSGSFRLPRTMPFSRSSLMEVYRDTIYTAWTEDFLIKEWDRQGGYQEAFYHRIEKSVLAVDDEKLSESHMQLIDENSDQLPDRWPALHAMTIDDEGRFWVFTITNDAQSFRGWVLTPNGEQLANFGWPGKRAERTPSIPPMLKVKDGYLYTRERDIGEGIDQIEKYKIIFKKR